MRPRTMPLGCTSAALAFVAGIFALPASVAASGGPPEGASQVIAHGPGVTGLTIYRDAVAWIEGGTQA